MIHVNRTAKPDILSKNEVAWNKTLADNRAEAINEAAPNHQQALRNYKNAQKHYSDPPIKDALMLMFGVSVIESKCAYCETSVFSGEKRVNPGKLSVDSNDEAQIEHFYPEDPKGVYWDKVLDWNNLLIVCPPCNQKKSNHFPLDVQGQPLWIDPTSQDPLQHFVYKVLPNTWEVEILCISAQGKYVRRTLDLSNRSGLKKSRDQVIKRCFALARIYSLTKEAEWIDALKDECDPKKPFSAFAKAIYDWIQQAMMANLSRSTQ